jgi:16S rRNA G966 N2-methylase RsmD
MKTSELKLNDKNPRKISKDKLEKLKQSIKDFEIMMAARPIVIDSNNIILGGNMRFTALKALGYKEIPDNWVYKMNDLTDEQKKEFIIKDNVGFGEWDWDILKFDFDEADLINWGLEFPVDMIEETILEAEEHDYEEPENIEVDVVLGDLIEFECTDGRVHKIICGDSTDVNNIDKLIKNEVVDFVFTDPMYQDSPLPIISIFEILKTKYFLIMATFKQCISFITDSGYNFRFDLVLNQKVPSSTMNKKVPYYLHKNLIYLTKDDTTIFNCDNAKGYFSDAGYYPSIIESSKNTSEVHGLTKNAEGIKLILSGFMFKTVLDLFIGSGSTMIAAHQLNRICYGIELDPKYCQVIIDRMQKLDSSIKVKINGTEYEQTKSNA